MPSIITTKTGSKREYSITMDPGPYSGDYTIDVMTADLQAIGHYLLELL